MLDHDLTEKFGQPDLKELEKLYPYEAEKYREGLEVFPERLQELLLYTHLWEHHVRKMGSVKK